MTFTGWHWSLVSGFIVSQAPKFMDFSSGLSSVLYSQYYLSFVSIPSIKWRLTWIALGNRTILSILFHNFHLLSNENLSSIQIVSSLEPLVISELCKLASLYILSSVRLQRQVWSIVIAFDASQYAGGIVYTQTTQIWFDQLLKVARNPFRAKNQTGDFWLAPPWILWVALLNTTRKGPRLRI